MKFSPGGSGVVREEQMKLFVSEGNPHCLKAVAALEVTGVKCDVQYVSHEGKTHMVSSLTCQSTCTSGTSFQTDLRWMATRRVPGRA